MFIVIGYRILPITKIEFCGKAMHSAHKNLLLYLGVPPTAKMRSRGQAFPPSPPAGQPFSPWLAPHRRMRAFRSILHAREQTPKPIILLLEQENPHTQNNLIIASVGGKILISHCNGIPEFAQITLVLQIQYEVANI